MCQTEKASRDRTIELYNTKYEMCRRCVRLKKEVETELDADECENAPELSFVHAHPGNWKQT